MKMNRLLPMLLVAGCITLGACKEKRQTEEIITTRYVPKKPGAPIRMEPKSTKENVSWLGKSYTVTITRTPVDSLPMVANEIGQKYIDNRISLVISRTDGSEFFSKSFSKASFMSYLTADYRKEGLLTDMRFKEVSGAEMVFGVIVSEPEATDDEFLPLVLAVNRDGGIGIKLEDDLDFLGDREDYEDEDEI